MPGAHRVNRSFFEGVTTVSVRMLPSRPDCLLPLKTLSCQCDAAEIFGIPACEDGRLRMSEMAA